MYQQLQHYRVFVDVDLIGLQRPPPSCLDVVIRCASQCECCSTTRAKGVTRDVGAEAGLEEIYNP